MGRIIEAKRKGEIRPISTPRRGGRRKMSSGKQHELLSRGKKNKLGH